MHNLRLATIVRPHNLIIPQFCGLVKFCECILAERENSTTNTDFHYEFGP